MKVSTKSHTPPRVDAVGRAGVWPRMVVGGVLVSVLATPAAGAAGWVAGGVSVAASAAAGVLLATGFLLVGLLGLRLVLGSHEALVLPGVMSILGFQLLALLGLWSAGRDGALDLEWIQPAAFAYGALAGALLWQAGLASVLMRARLTVGSEQPTGECAV